MKDQSSYKKNKGGKYLFFLILTIFIFIIIFFLKNTFFNTFLSSSKIFQEINLALISKKKIMEDNEELKKQLNFYKESENLFFFLKGENKDLKERLNYINFLNKERFLFDVIGEDKLFYKTILLFDSKNILEKGDLVFSKYNFLFGKVISSENKIAKVERFDAFGKENTYKIFDGGIEKIEIKGLGQGSGIIKILGPRNLEFENPEKVFLVYEKNNSYLIAKLVDVNFKKQDTNKALYFQIFSNPNLLSKVEVEKTKEREVGTFKIKTEEKNE